MAPESTDPMAVPCENISMPILWQIGPKVLDVADGNGGTKISREI
jgi:hypothetical protein